ncbi:MAG: envelope stress response membrane protein PspB [Rhodospirillaceae bacterium]
MMDYIAFMPFITAIVIVWLVFHYRNQRKVQTMSSSEEQQTMERMIALLEKMESRIITLEKILDAEDPRWREKVPPTEHL